MNEMNAKIVIAHRGASGYVAEHTNESVAFAHALGADFIEPDVVLSKDGVPIVLHDIHLDTVSDVAKKFPDSARKDGRFFAIDFTLAEIKTLQVHERIDLATNKAVFPGRFPLIHTVFSIPTLKEYIELVQGLNHSRGRKVGIYPEIKEPTFHLQEGQDITKIVYELLLSYGYNEHPEQIYVQCFDPPTLKRLKHDFKTKMPLIQLIDDEESSWFPPIDQSESIKSAFKEIASYANGIGPSIHFLFQKSKTDPKIFKATPFSSWAKAEGLLIHPYTVRADSLPSYMSSMDQLLEELYVKQNVDGVFTDFSDKAISFLKGKR